MDKAQRAEAIRNAVEWLVENGFSPWPIVPGTKQPMDAGADRRTWGGRRHRPLDASERAKTWGGNSPPDVAAVVQDGRFVLDLDPKNNPIVVRMFEDLKVLTLCATTPSGGLHAYFAVDGKVPTIDPALGVDVQGSGSLVIAPPSRGRAWANDLPIRDWSAVRAEL